MRNIFLAPRSNETAYKNYISSMQGIPKSDIEKYLNHDEKDALSDLDTIHAWGCQPSLEGKWASMQHGDYVFFYTRGRFVSVGQLIFKKKSADLALALWPRSKETNEPWTCVFFVDGLFEIDLSLEEFNAITGYELTAVMGFMPVRKGLEKIQQRFGDVEGFVDTLKTGLDLEQMGELASLSKSKLSHDSLENISKFDELTRNADDERIEAALRKHAEAASDSSPEKVTKVLSSYKRNKKLVDDLKKKYENKCQICGFTFLTSSGLLYSEAAHIIPISSGKAGVDSPDNIWVLCANHHRMLDFGAIKAISATQYKEGGKVKLLLKN